MTQMNKTNDGPYYVYVRNIVGLVVGQVWESYIGTGCKYYVDEKRVLIRHKLDEEDKRLLQEHYDGKVKNIIKELGLKYPAPKIEILDGETTT